MKPNLPLDRRGFIVSTSTLIAASPIITLHEAAAAPSVAPESDAVRSRTRLAQWRFHLGHAADVERDFGFGRDQRTFAKAGAATADVARPDFEASGWEVVQVPHDWAPALPFAEPSAPLAQERADAAAAHGFPIRTGRRPTAIRSQINYLTIKKLVSQQIGLGT